MVPLHQTRHRRGGKVEYGTYCEQYSTGRIKKTPQARAFGVDDGPRPPNGSVAGGDQDTAPVRLREDEYKVGTGRAREASQVAIAAQWRVPEQTLIPGIDSELALVERRIGVPRRGELVRSAIRHS